MTVDAHSFSPLIIGFGGAMRPNSSTDKTIRLVLEAAGRRGARVQQLSGSDIAFPLYAPENAERTAAASAFIDLLRQADGIVIGSPAYHGGISGLVKNALDYTQDMAADDLVYFDGMAVGCVATGAGWQGANTTLAAMRAVVHTLRGWPTPLGIAVNTIEPVFAADGQCVVPGLVSQAEIMADQLVRFARQDRSMTRHNRRLVNA